MTLICLSTSASPAFRSFTFPACHFARKLVNVSRCAEPSGVTGIVADRGWTKIFVNAAKFGSGLSSGDFAAAAVEGTFRMPFENVARACVFVVRYLTRSHAMSVFLPPFGMPMSMGSSCPAVR